MSDLPLFDLCLRMGDTCLVLAQRTSEWIGHAPVLEEDIGLANIALDLVGQTQLWLGLAAEVEGKGRSADELAYRRDQGAYRNLLIAERPNGDFGHTLMRQYLFDAWHYPMLQGLTASSDSRVAEIAEKALKEVSYHIARSADLVISLGDGTPESHARMQAALNDLWPYTGEMLIVDEVDAALCEAGLAPDLEPVSAAWHAHVEATLTQATLAKPASGYMHKGGKRGLHSEHLGYILAEMQFLQRAYPTATW
ncbi:1,2-phenylacetyl-CoA epoxidase subunit PaaC [Pannonibacter sp. SL95]|uniref:1,2-phenylacetyl-CoA epoxidase subunit PaaC n=1 Tax=Pannonibacter sp. SL95 TaxID=2995153 RepID=UPI0022748DDF|nr:1,2-phenylacetyl-CoA epoxidase subunit PaaC [Pannonibacter sp. SL95]MCY1706273.1 phenylacetate-CoA oxygenase subunit PaaC [Pannonibacter sp. SL95]